MDPGPAAHQKPSPRGYRVTEPKSATNGGQRQGKKSVGRDSPQTWRPTTRQPATSFPSRCPSASHRPSTCSLPQKNLGGAGIRVPVPNGSLTDLTCTLSKPASVKEINNVFKEASETYLKGILEYTEDPIVSRDVIGNTHSAVFDAGLTAVLGDKNRFVKVVAWYDNEMGYSSRLVELIEKFV